MNYLHNVVCVHWPNLLQSVPIPESFGGLFHLSLKELLGLATFGAVTGALGYSVYTTVMVHMSKRKALINLDISKHLNKCATVVDVESIDKKTSYCRCWRSAKFPFCDGAHNKHNEETGDNVGPLVIEPKKTA
ncbi:Zinc finger CDGSH domain-containing protein 1 [Fasciolopsis buskii]|uniref:CDGSH iron-sulfur domain-containing protein 2 homologue n=1 Tax=Fasciolopsis buskii TaxID=27845 RepID=A0A8E0VQA1_9TREM|nr:Zinc finger CDGSH domain-containing protein 1 [Fasciolopsis buski]